LIYKCAKGNVFPCSIRAVIVTQSLGCFLWATRYIEILYAQIDRNVLCTILFLIGSYLFAHAVICSI